MKFFDRRSDASPHVQSPFAVFATFARQTLSMVPVASDALGALHVLRPVEDKRCRAGLVPVSGRAGNSAACLQGLNQVVPPNEKTTGNACGNCWDGDIFAVLSRMGYVLGTFAQHRRVLTVFGPSFGPFAT